MKLKMNYVTFSVTIFIVLFALRLLWYMAVYPDVKLIADKGQIDIKADYILNDEYMYLEGEWLVETDGVKQYVQSNELMQLKQDHISLIMVVKVDSYHSTPISIQIPSSTYRTATYINDQLLSSNYNKHGTVYQSHRVTFYPDSEQFILRIEIEGKGGGVSLPISDRYIAIGSSEAVELRSNIGNIFAIAVVSILVMVLLSCLVFYIFITRAKLVLFIILILTFPIIGELYMLALPYIQWIKLPYNVEAKMFTSLYFISFFVLLYFLRYLAGKHDIPNSNIISMLYVLTFVLILLIPIEYMDIMSMYLIVFYIIWTGYFSYHVLRFYIISRYEMYSLLYVCLSVLSGLIWAIIKNNIHYDIPFYPYDYFGMMLGFIGFWLNRYIQNSKEIAISSQKKEQFLQSVSEQLSIPLNKLDLDLDSQYSIVSDEVERERLQMMMITVSGMSFVLNNWLDYSKLKDGTLKVQRQPVDTVATLNHVGELVRENLQVTDIVINTHEAHFSSSVISDSKLLSQVLYNLIYIQLEQQKHRKLYLECSNVLSNILIKIEDGTKVGEERFVWSTETDLPIAVQICEEIIFELGGSLEYKESGYLIWLPCSQDQPLFDSDKASESIPSESIAVEQSKDSSRVLVYSNEMNTLATVQFVAQDLGYNLTQVNSREEFMLQYEANVWDLIILDSALKESSSIEVLQLIRNRYNLIDLPVLMAIVPTSLTVVSNYFHKGMNDYVNRPIHAIELKYKLQTLLQTKALFDQRIQLEASLLQNQVEPHFLFNTLNSIASLSTIDVDRMVMLLEQFGHYLSRGFNKRLLQELIELQDEIDIVKSYLYIEELRYEPYLKVEWDIEEVFDVKIPPYSVQTIVENAIKHGIRKKKYGGTIKLSVKKHDSYVQIKVADDGVGMSREKLDSLFTNDINNGIGFYNTHIRLKRSFGEGLVIESEEGEGTSVSFNLPLSKMIKSVDN